MSLTYRLVIALIYDCFILGSVDDGMCSVLGNAAHCASLFIRRLHNYVVQASNAW